MPATRKKKGRRPSVRQRCEEECTVLPVIRLLLLFKPDYSSEQRRFEGRGRAGRKGGRMGKAGKILSELTTLGMREAEEVENEEGERGGKFRSYFSPSFPLLSLCLCVCVAFRPPPAFSRQ